MNEEFLNNKSKDIGLSIAGTRRVLESVFKESNMLLPILEAAISKTNYEETQSVSHRLKGIFANLQFNQISRIAHEINLAAINKKDWGEIRNFQTDLVNSFEILKKESGI